MRGRALPLAALLLLPPDLTGGCFAIDTAGQPWAKLDGKEHPFVSTFQNGQWNHVPLPQGMKPLFLVWSAGTSVDGLGLGMWRAGC